MLCCHTVCSFHSDGRLYQATDWPLSRSLTIGEIVVGEDTIFERKDGSRATIRIWSASARSTDGTIVAAVAVAEDVTGPFSVRAVFCRGTVGIRGVLARPFGL
jgi:hypothetical protein